MTKQTAVFLAIAIALSGSFGLAQQQQAPPQPMSFFVASAGGGNGANLGGLAGADAVCQRLGAAAGRGSVT